MLVIPVIDLMQGQVVRGVAGRRSEYRPIVSQIAADARPATVARALVEQFGCDTAYVADLDAICRRPPNVSAWQAISAAGLKLWLDAGLGDPQACAALQAELRSLSIAAEIVIGLESLQDPAAKDWPVVPARSPGSIFSLDLQCGVPLHQVPAWRDKTALEIGRSAHALGFSNLLVLDLADVGTGRGTRTIQLCGQLLRELNPLQVIAGGGIRGLDDLRALASAGCHAALVASALHDGRLTPVDLLPLQQL